jgi:hypothetical protein
MAGRTLEELALQVALEHVLHCESLRYLPTGVQVPPLSPPGGGQATVLGLTSACSPLRPSQLRMWEEVSVMVPITAALLRKFDLHLLAANKTLGGTTHAHTTPHTHCTPHTPNKLC